MRGWEIQTKIAIDPTSSLGEKIKVLINNNKIIQVEPVNKNQYFISDKTRQFYDSLLGIEYNFDNCLEKLVDFYIKTLYFFDLYSFQNKFTNYFFIVFENIGVDTLSLLTFFEQKYSFIKLTRLIQKKVDNDFENTVILNNYSLKKVNVSLLVATNVNYECVSLHLKLKQRSMKGNFKFFNLSSSLKNSSVTLGSSVNVLKLITEGNNFVCQDFFMKKLSIVINSDLFKRNDSPYILKLLLNFQNLQLSSCINTINSSIFETGVLLLNKFDNLFKHNLFLNIVHAINTTCYFDNFLMTNYRFKQRKFLTKELKRELKNEVVTFYKNDNLFLNINKVFNLPVKNFFESNQLLINNKGVLQTTIKILNTNNKKNSPWKLTRYIFNSLKKNSLISSDFLISFTKITNYVCFKNIFYLFFVIFNNFITKKIIDFSNNSFILINFSLKKIKLINSRIKYWLNDFFIGNLDSLSSNSLVLTKCSENYRLQTTTFF